LMGNGLAKGGGLARRAALRALPLWFPSARAGRLREIVTEREVRERGTEREAARERGREREAQRERHSERVTKSEAERERGAERDARRERHRERGTEREALRETHASTRETRRLWLLPPEDFMPCESEEGIGGEWARVYFVCVRQKETCLFNLGRNRHSSCTHAPTFLPPPPPYTLNPAP